MKNNKQYNKINTLLNKFGKCNFKNKKNKNNNKNDNQKNFLSCHNCKSLNINKNFPINTLRLCKNCIKPDFSNKNIESNEINKFSHLIGKKVLSKNTYFLYNDRQPHRYFGIIISSNNNNFKIEWTAAFNDICYQKKNVSKDENERFSQYEDLKEIIILNL